MSHPVGSALIYIPSGVNPAAIFTGRTLLERAAALAHAAGLEPVVVDARPGDRARAVGGLGLAPGSPLPAAGPVMLLRCDAGCVAGVLRDLASRAEPCVVRDDAGRAALVRTSAAALGGALPADLEAAAAGIVAAPRAGWLGQRRIVALGFATTGLDPGAVDSARARAERELLATLDNPRDGFVDGLVNRHLSRPLSHALLPFPVTPNQVTVFALLLALAGAACLALPGVAAPVFGALLLQVTAILDCVDGEIARAKVLESEWGEWLDITSDTLIHVATFLGIAVHAWPQLGGGTAWLLGTLFTVGGLASFVVVTRAEKTEARWLGSPAWESRLLAGLLATLTTRDTSVLVLAAAATGLLTPLLVGAAFGAQAFWAGTLVLHTRAMRRAA